jgi:adenylate cyclase
MKRAIRVVRDRHYPISVGEAWRILGDTDHLNRTIGLPSVQFTVLPGSRDRLVLRGRGKAYGLVPVSWREYPFDWIRERRYAVRREFEHGPVSVVEGGIELLGDGDGVTVTSFAEFTPANVAGRVLWRLGAGIVDDTLTYCDRYLARKENGKADPTPIPSAKPDVDTAHLDRLIELLAKAPVDQQLIALLRERIIEGSDDQVVGIKPFALADVWGVERMDVLSLFLHATRIGLFELRWELMCPNCRVPKAESRKLGELPPQFHCEVCGISYQTEFDQRVELRFAVHPAVRRAFDSVYCVGGPLRMPHIVAQQYLRPHEDRRIDVTLGEPLRLRTVGGTHQLSILPVASDGRTKEVRITYAGGRWVGPHSMLSGEILSVPVDAAIALRNQTEGPVLAVIEDIEWTGDATTAAQVTTLQEFRDLFSSEVLAPDQYLAVRDIALLFSDLKGSTQLYEDIGDAPAYSRVNRHFEFMKDHVSSGRGTIVKTMGDGVMCAFERLDDALEAALSMQRDVTRWCEAQNIVPPLTLKIGVHRGPVIALTANDQLDYFGRTVNVASRLGGESTGGDVVLVADVLNQVARRSLLDPEAVAVETFSASLRGVQEQQTLARLTLISDALKPVH